MATTNKYGIGLFNTRNDTSAWNILDHTGIGSSVPNVFCGFMVGATTPGFTATHMRFSKGVATFSLDGTKQNIYWAARNQDGLSTPDRDIVGEIGGGPGYMELTTTLYRVNVTSPVPGGFQNQRATSGLEFVSSPLYASFFLAASLEHETNYASTLNSASGSTSINSIGFRPDILFISGGIFYTGGAGFAAFVNNAIGIQDCRTLDQNRGAFIGNVYWNEPDDTSIRMVSKSGLPYPNYYNVGGRVLFEVNTIDNNGFGLAVTENNSGFSSNQEFSYLALKFNDANTNWRVDMFTTPNTAAGGTGIIQTNSLLPEFILGFGSNVQTLDFLINSESSHGDTMSFGMAASHKAVCVSVSEDTSSSTATNNFNFGNDDAFLNTFSINGGARYSITSLDFQSGYLGYTVNGDPLNWPNQYIGALIVGEAVNAPGHIQDEAGGSIFLTGTENYDDLLLIQSGPPAGSQYARRDYPRREYRDYPVQINELRDYPNE